MRYRSIPLMLLAGCAAHGVTPPPLAADVPVVGAMLERPLSSCAADAPLRFLVAGHVYGDPFAEAAPADTLRVAVDDLARSGAALMVCCGDSFRTSTTACFDRTLRALEPLPFPVFQAVGNHDVAARATFVERFGRTWGAFVHGGCAFVVLDTEEQPWEIQGEQLDFLRAALRHAADRDDVRAVFCFAHKLVFAHRRRYFPLLAGGNALDGLPGVNRFVADVLPLLADVARDKPVCWFGGDVGAPHSLPCFAERDPGSGVWFLATGLGDRPRDVVLEVVVRGRDVDVTARSLTGASSPRLADCDVAAWRRALFPEGMPDRLARLRGLLPE